MKHSVARLTSLRRELGLSVMCDNGCQAQCDRVTRTMTGNKTATFTSLCHHVSLYSTTERPFLAMPRRGCGPFCAHECRVVDLVLMLQKHVQLPIAIAA